MKHFYRIQVRGHLGDGWSDWFAGLHMTQLATGETQLIGALDQTALHGVLARIRDLNLPLIAVNQISKGEATNEGYQQEQKGQRGEQDL